MLQSLQPHQTELDDGSVLVDLSPDSGAPGAEGVPEQHDANLAEHLPSRLLASIADCLIEGIRADKQSSEDYHQVCREGVKLLGLHPEKRVAPFEGACGVYHPILMEAVLRFQASARAEMLPAAGPVRTEMLDTDDATQVEMIATRKQQWLNYYLTSVYEDYYPDFDQMLVYLGIYGSAFKKIYSCPIKRRPVAPFILPEQLILSYDARDIQSANRVTHETQMSRGELVRMQLAGAYRQIALADPSDSGEGEESVGDLSEGRTRSMALGDERHTVWECHCDLDIEHEGLEHVGQDGEPTGLPVPYIVSIERDSQEVLSLRRNWRPDDKDYSRLQWFVHYRMMPGLGVYGWGLAHILGGSADAATKLRRQFIDGLTLSNFPGGFRRKGMRLTENGVTIGPCEFQEIDTGGGRIQDAIMPLPYKEPGQGFVAALEEIVQSGQRVGSTQDTAVGDGREDAPVGTTIALIEKATRLESTIIKRLHSAHRQELRLIAAQFAEVPPGTVYPYKVAGQHGQALAEDFQDTDDIIPVSDPNTPTQTQRLALAQAKLTMAQSAPPGSHDVVQCYKEMYATLGLTPAEIARIMPDKTQVQPLDPVTENASIVQSKPVKAGPTQDHQSHVKVHMSLLQTPAAQAPGIAPAVMAHAAEHFALWYQQQFAALAQAHGIQLPPPGQPMPTQLEAQLSQGAAQFCQQIAQQAAAFAPQQTGGDPAAAAQAQAELQFKAQELAFKQADSQRKAEGTARQDQSSTLRLQQQLQDNEAQRQAQHAQAMVELQQARLKAQADMHGDRADVARTVVDGLASAHADRHAVAEQGLKTLGEIHSATAAVETAKHEAKGNGKSKG